MYGGFYTRQEQEDALAARLEPHPNRVGTGFINFGAMERQTQPAANWQTGGLMGGAGGTPAQVSDIWNSTPAQTPTVQPAAAQRLQPPHAPQISVQAQLAPQPFAAAPGPSCPNTCALFQSLGIDSAPTLRPEAAFSTGVGAGVTPSYAGLNDVAAMSAAAAKPPPPPTPPPPPPTQSLAPPTQSLMSLLQPPQQPQAQLNSAFAMCNGVPPSACGSRAQAAFANPIAAAPQCQLPPNGVHSAAFASGAFVPPVSHAPPPRPPQSAAPRPLASAADYAVAAANYKPPTAARVSNSVANASVSRKPETSKVQPQHTAMKTEWECPRCTFLNNAALRECEMCGFERPGVELDAPVRSSEDDGWRVAAASVRKNAPVPSNTAQTGKSKAQAKNEKRRAKKRGDNA